MRSRKIAACLEVEELESRTLLAPITWNGDAKDFKWETPGNWDGGMVPTVNDDVEIQIGQCNIDNGGFAKSLKVGARVVLYINTTLTIDGGSVISSTARDQVYSSSQHLEGGCG